MDDLLNRTVKMLLIVAVLITCCTASIQGDTRGDRHLDAAWKHHLVKEQFIFK